MELINEGAKKNKPRAICSKEVVVRGLVERCRVPQRGHDRLEISEQRGCNAGEAVCSRDKVTPLSLDSSFVKTQTTALTACGSWEEGTQAHLGRPFPPFLPL